MKRKITTLFIILVTISSSYVFSQEADDSTIHKELKILYKQTGSTELYLLKPQKSLNKKWKPQEIVANFFCMMGRNTGSLIHGILNIIKKLFMKRISF